MVITNITGVIFVCSCALASGFDILLSDFSDREESFDIANIFQTCNIYVGQLR